MEPITVLKAASMAVVAVKSYFEHQRKEELKRQNDLIQSKIDTEIKLYKNSFDIALNKAKSLLKDAHYATNNILKEQYLSEAKCVYTDLINLPEKEEINGHYIDNTYLICAGYYGRFQVFGMLNDYKNGTRQIYECAIKFPANAVILFDDTFFPSIDVSSLRELCENMEKLHDGTPLTGIYADIPCNLAHALLERQLNKYIDSFKQILNTII